MSVPNRRIIVGCSYDFADSFTDDGSAKDMTGLVGMLRLISDDKVTTITRLTSDATQWTWTSQAAGTGTWHWESDETLTTGSYESEVYVYDASSPINRTLTNEDETKPIYTIEDPDTGSF